MMKTVSPVVTLLWLSTVAAANIFSEVPQPGERIPPQANGDYSYSPLSAGSTVPIDISGTFSWTLQGDIPPNATLAVDIADALGGAGAYQVIGVGWDVQLDAFIPSWMSDATISFGDDATFADPDLVIVPGLGLDFGGFMHFESGGIIDLTDVDGADMSFELSDGNLYLEFFETFDDFGYTIPDAQWRSTSTLTVQVTQVPEPTTLASLAIALLVMARSYRRRRN